jgi:hypothetical protein
LQDFDCFLTAIEEQNAEKKKPLPRALIAWTLLQLPLMHAPGIAGPYIETHN